MLLAPSTRYPVGTFLEVIESWCQRSVSLAEVSSLLVRNRDTKLLVEEVLPVYWHTRQLITDGIPLAAVALAGRDDVPDAQLFGADGKLLLGLEVTCVFDKLDHEFRRREAAGLSLAEHLESRCELTPNTFRQSVNSTLESKARKQYPERTHLLVVLNSDYTLDREGLSAFVKTLAVPRDHSFQSIVFYSPNGIRHSRDSDDP